MQYSTLQKIQKCIFPHFLSVVVESKSLQSSIYIASQSQLETIFSEIRLQDKKTDRYSFQNLIDVLVQKSNAIPEITWSKYKILQANSCIQRHYQRPLNQAPYVCINSEQVCSLSLIYNYFQFFIYLLTFCYLTFHCGCKGIFFFKLNHFLPTKT